jgi:CO dehydrogenase/acetyl-CoA synthase epsilon subunit
MCIKEAPQKRIFEEIRQPHQLRHVKVNDRSAPVIPSDVHITIPKTEALLVAGKERFNSALSTAKQVAYSIGKKTQQVAHTLEEKIGYKFTTADEGTFEFVKFVDTVASPKELELVKSHLKATQTIDKSKPVIDTDVHIRNNRHRELFAEIELRRELKPSKIEHDASAPFIAKDMHIKQNTHRELLAEIVKPQDLKHVATHDTTAPFIPKDIHIKESTQKKVLDAGKERLNTALTTAKQVAHTIGEKTHQVAQTLEEKTGYKLTAPDPKEEFVQFVDPLASPRDLEEVKSHLKHAQTRDKSKPVIERDVHIKENHHKDLFVEIEKSHDLHHVKTTHDASSPIIDKGVHIKEAPQKRILSDITQHHQLKHVSINDKSAPVIPKDIHIVKKKMLIE